MTPKAVRFLLGLVFIGSILIRIPLLSVPLERDEGEYAYIAWRMSQGEVPYRDHFDQKPPGVFFLYYLTFLFDDSVEAIHGMMHLYTLATIALIFFLTRELSGSPGAGLLAAAAFSIATAQPAITGQAANTEIFMLLPLVGSLLVFMRRWGEGRFRDLFWAGLLIGTASLFKQVALTTVLPVIGLQAWFEIRRNPVLGTGRAFLSAAVTVTGILAAWVPVLLYFGAHGAVGSLINDVFLHNFRYLSTSRNAFSLQVLARNYFPLLRGEWPLWGAAFFGLYVLFSESAARGLFVLLWLVSAAAGISASAYFFPHYFLQATPIQAVLSGVGMALLWKEARRRFEQRGALLAALITACVLANPLVGDARLLLRGSPEQISYRIYPGNIFPDTVRVAEYIRENSSPSDSIFVFGSEPQIPFYAKRRNVSRFEFLFPLFGNYPDALKNQYEVYYRIVKENPKFIVVALNLLFFAQGSEQMLFERVNKLLMHQYALDGLVLLEDRRIEHIYGQSKVSGLGKQDPKKILIQVFRRRY